MKTVNLPLCLILGYFISSCVHQKLFIPETNVPSNFETALPSERLPIPNLREERYRKRRSIPTDRSQYEGSLWRDESSWGNLFRDHRARFKGDVVTITNIPEILSFDDKDLGSSEQDDPSKIILSKGEKERIQIQKAIQTIPARVVKVLSNGNMVVIGEKIEYRRQNLVQYITTVKGIIRPEDVDDNNEIKALKLARAEIQTRRRIKSKALRLRKKVSKQAGVLDRLKQAASKKLNTSVNQATTPAANQAN